MPKNIFHKKMFAFTIKTLFLNANLELNTTI